MPPKKTIATKRKLDRESSETPTTANSAPNKRARKPDESCTTAATRSAPDAKAIKAKNVPVDDSCPIKSSSEVYIHDDGCIYDASLNQTNIGENNNKFYYIQVLKLTASTAYAVWTHWGRVGENGQNKLEQDLTLEFALESFGKKFKSKTGLSWEGRNDPPKANKYTVIDKSYMGISDDDDGRQNLEDEPKTRLSPEVQELMGFLFNAGNMRNSMASQNYNFNKLPLGKLSKSTLEKGYLALKELGEVITDPKLAKKLYKGALEDVYSDLTSKYYSVIPHDFGRARPTVINSEAQLKAELDLVETLGNMQISNGILKHTEFTRDREGKRVHPLDARFNSLGLDELVPRKTMLCRYV